MRIFSIFILLLFCFLCTPKQAHAINEAMFESLQKNMLELQKTVESLQTMVQQQNEVIREQGLQISNLQKGTPVSSSTLSGPSAVGPLKLAGLRNLNPDIGVTGTVEARLTEDTEDGEGKDTIALKEMELNISQYVDPYSRLDAIIAFNDALEEQNVDIEEAYYSHFGLPLGFRGQIGKFRAKIGKQNLQHLHQLTTSNYPLVIQDFFGEEGLASSGARLAHDIPNPWDLPLDITGEILRGNNGPSFSGISRRPIFNTHLKTFIETSEDSNLELGWTTLFGDENPAVFVDGFDEDGNPMVTEVIREKGSGRYGVKVFGADATFIMRLPEGKVFTFQNELYFQNRGTTRHVNGNPWGFYNLLDYRFHPRFSTGIRFDYVEPLDIIANHHGTYAVSPYITFWQSEFANFRLQYSHTQPADAEAKRDNEIFLTANILIGAHQHPVA